MCDKDVTCVHMRKYYSRSYKHLHRLMHVQTFKWKAAPAVLEVNIIVSEPANSRLGWEVESLSNNKSHTTICTSERLL